MVFRCILFSFIFLDFFRVTAQQVINTNGFSAQIGGNTYEFSLGELVIHTKQNNTMQLTEGFLQPVSIVLILSEQSKENKWNVYPNPFSRFLVFKHKATIQRDSEMLIYNAQQQIVYTAKIPANEKEIKLEDYTSSWPAGVYYAVIYEDGVKPSVPGLQYFKLIKM